MNSKIDWSSITGHEGPQGELVFDNDAKIGPGGDLIITPNDGPAKSIQPDDLDEFRDPSAETAIEDEDDEDPYEPAW
jgi:hypothetical protein